METLAQRLSKALELKGAKQIQLARATEQKPSSVSLWFNGTTKNLRGENLLKAAEFLDVNPEWLGSGIGAMERDATPKLEVTELLDQLFDKVAQTPESERAKIGTNLNFLAQSKSKEEASIYIKMLVDILNIYTLRVYTQQEYENLKSKTAAEETAKMKQELKMGDMSMVQEQTIIKKD